MDVDTVMDATVVPIAKHTKVGQDNVGHQIGADKPRPFISNESAEVIRFQVPAQPTYAALGSIFSILSLIFMSVLSTVMLMQLVNPEHNLIAGWQASAGTGLWANIVNVLRPPAATGEMAAWVWIPFLFTIFGSTLGWLFELGLLLTGIPFQQTHNRFTTFILKIRLLNLAPVTTTIFFFVCAMVIPEPNLRMALLYVAGAACFGLAAALFFGGASAVPMILLGTQLAQFVIVLASETPVGGSAVATLLMVQAVLQATALLIGTATPFKSTGFHVISTISGVMLYGAIVRATAVDADFSHQVAPVIPAGSLLMWGLVVACVAGLVFTMKASPMTYSNWRAAASNAIWSIQYFLLVSLKRFPKPFNLSEIYKDGAPAPTKLKPYYQQHPEFLPQALSIPAAEKLEGSVTAFSQLLAKVKKAFSVIALMDHFFPQANLNIPLKDKPRMNIWSNGADIYPQIFLKKIFGYTIPGRSLEATPEPAIKAFKKGQLLAYLAESGVANTFVRPLPERGEGALVMDFRFLEKYETKADYEPYGGMAYLRVNSDSEQLELVAVVAPHASEEIAADPMDPAFRHAESLVLASLYYQVISGKHLAEIHMTYNLVEVALHNAFDAQGQFNHPLRTFMYLHLFSQELAEEMTTEHLVQDGAVFSQIFATTHDSLIIHLNDCYHRFEYGVDEDFEARTAAMTMANGKTLPNACINWELRYAQIWQRYSDDLIDIIYADDHAVRADTYLQDLYRGLNEVMLRGLPARYAGFQSKAGVSRWASDTIHHLVIRHQVYGTTGVKAAMDPRISTTQVPKDGGTPGVDEWRSLICVALATARSRFTLLVGKHGQDFTYLLDGVDEHCKRPMAKVFEQLQKDLLALDREWAADAIEKEYNYNYFRALPSDLHTGPGY